MKIVFINTLYPPYQVGGAERALQILAEGLLEKGVEPVVVALNPIAEDTVETINGVRVYRVPLANFYWPFRDDVRRPPVPWRVAWHVRDVYNPTMAKRIRGILLREGPHLVHTHNLVGFSVSVWSVAVKMGLPIVHTVHDYSLMCPRGMYRNGVNCKYLCGPCRIYAQSRRQMSHLVTSVVGVSSFVLERHIRMGFFRWARRGIIYNAVSSGLVTSRLGNNPRLRLGYLGRLDPHKGLQDVLRVLNSSSELRERVELIVGGRGKQEHEAKLRAQAANLEVRWLGFVPPEELFSQIDILVVPSRCQEPFARVIIEAYASGRPVIAARRGGMPEIVEEWRTGWLYDPDDPGELEIAIRTALQHRGCLDTMSFYAREKAKEFGVKQHLDSYVRVYQDAIGA